LPRRTDEASKRWTPGAALSLKSNNVLVREAR